LTNLLFANLIRSQLSTLTKSGWPLAPEKKPDESKEFKLNYFVINRY